jgi:serine protease AprX
MKKAAWLALALTLSGGLLFGQSKSKFSSELQNVDPQANVDVIVQFDQAPTDAHHQKVLSRGGQLRQTLNLVKAGAYRMPASAIADLANEPSVVHISVDHKLGAKLDYAAAAINASTAWTAGWNGTGVGVAVIDSGIMNSSKDFFYANSTASRVVYAQDFTGQNQAGKDPYGHGTHVAGIVGGNGYNSLHPPGPSSTRSLIGMAPNANLIDLRVLDQNGQSSDSTVIAAINQAIALKSKYNIRVINLSLGRAVTESYTLDPLCQAVEAAWKAGIVVVVAAGNDGRDNSVGEHGYGTINAPGNDPYVNYRRRDEDDGHLLANRRSHCQL